jgi:hypothetical protein
VGVVIGFDTKEGRRYSGDPALLASLQRVQRAAMKCNGARGAGGRGCVCVHGIMWRAAVQEPKWWRSIVLHLLAVGGTTREGRPLVCVCLAEGVEVEAEVEEALWVAVLDWRFLSPFRLFALHGNCR